MCLIVYEIPLYIQYQSIIAPSRSIYQQWRHHFFIVPSNNQIASNIQTISAHIDASCAAAVADLEASRPQPSQASSCDCLLCGSWIPWKSWNGGHWNLTDTELISCFDECQTRFTHGISLVVRAPRWTPPVERSPGRWWWNNSQKNRQY